MHVSREMCRKTVKIENTYPQVDCHPLKIVDRISETRFQVDKNFNGNFKGLENRVFIHVFIAYYFLLVISEDFKTDNLSH